MILICHRPLLLGLLISGLLLRQRHLAPKPLSIKPEEGQSYPHVPFHVFPVTTPTLTIRQAVSLLRRYEVKKPHEDAKASA